MVMIQEQSETATAPPSAAPDPRYAALAMAMRTGALTGPQCYGMMFDQEASCALGALVLGLLGHRTYSVHHAIHAHLGLDIDQIVVRLPPETTNLAQQGAQNAWTLHGEWTLRGAIIALNDAARWSRSRIADWLESLGTAGCP